MVMRMLRTRLVIVAASVAAALAASGGACGRLDFGFSAHVEVDARPGSNPDDAAIDAPFIADFADHCVVLLKMDEDKWIDHNGSGSGSGSGSNNPAGSGAGSGAATDLVNACDTGSNAGLLTGFANTTNDPVRGRVGLFTQDACIELGTNQELEATTAVTTMAWVKMTGNPVDSFGIVSKRQSVGSGGEYSMYIWTDSKIWADIDSENDRWGGTGAVPTNVWTQIAMVYDGTKPESERVRLYINGELDAVGPETSPSIPQLGSPLSIGCLPLFGPAQTFIGSLDDVGVWTRAFSPAEVRAWYQSTKM